MPVETVPFKVIRNGDFLGDRPAYYERIGGAWKATSWRVYADQVISAAKAMIALGIEPGEVVTILGFNQPSWVIADVAAMAIGAVPAGIYTTNSPRECHYILDHSDSPLLVIEDEGQWAKIDEIRDSLPNLRRVVIMDGGPAIDDPLVMSWEDFIAAGADIANDQFDARLAALEPNQLATLIYTSGTTGPPKGVMLTHDNLVWTATQAVDAAGIGKDDSSVSYLPLSHIAEQVFSVHGPAASGWAVYYAESIDKLADNLKEVQPTVFFAVPRVWERFYAGVTAKLAEATGVKAKLAAWAMGVATKVTELRNHGKEPTGALAAQYKVADKLVLSKVKAALGLSKVVIMITSAAPISAELLEFFGSLDLRIQEVYGQSEDCGPSTFNLADAIRFGSGGRAFPGTEMRIAEDGEILVKGRHVFAGYYRDPEATAEALVDGWLHSGDLGEIDEEGFLWITGRKKDIIITAGGKNIAPKPLEGGLKNHELISEAVVIGDRRKFLSVLVTLDDEAAERYMLENNLAGPAHLSPEIKAELQEAVDELNTGFARVEQLKKFAVLPRQLSIEGGELTPTLKVKRNKVTEHFADVIDGMYQD
ncbi:MAG: AMP-binding protein [bacterium]|nr:AMP-binding protein [bacterium]